jgi:hypothetical protein
VTVDQSGLFGYSLELMRSAFQTLRMGIATGISLWIGLLACFMGCALPALASPGAHDSSIHRNAVDGQLATMATPGYDPMAGMENCPHHSGGSTPAKPGDGKSEPGRMSCCPLEITVATKPDPSALAMAPAQDFALASHFLLQPARSFPVEELTPPLFHNGRETLLQSRLLRI